jgi:hypothetical protein
MSSIYPRHLNVNFRKLNKVSLLKLLKHYGVDEAKSSKSQAELAALVARIFDSSSPIENQIIDKFAGQYCHADADAGISKKRTFSAREQLDREPAMLGEQVAAKVSKQTDEEASWILGNVLDYNHTTLTYEIQDEDDISRVMSLPSTDVKRLDDSSSHLRRGDSVMAVFPETTSFYRATVVKNPKPSGFKDDVIVKFKDDEDNNGKNPARKIPARFVLRRGDIEDTEDSDEDDD